MDSLIAAAARELATGDALGALKRVALRDDPPALAMREFSGSPRSLVLASETLHAHGDRANALQGRLIALRRLLLIGRLDEAAAALANVDAYGLPPSLAAVAELAATELALRSFSVFAPVARPRRRTYKGRDLRHALCVCFGTPEEITLKHGV